MKQLKKIALIIGLLASIFLLSSCSVLNSYVDHKIDQQAEANIQNTAEYQKYEQYQVDGILDENGTYDLEEVVPDEESSQKNLIPVTFANNSFLRCAFHVNSEDDLPIGTGIIYLEPGDSLYVSSIQINNSLSNLYGFSEFRIWSYDSEGHRSSKPYAEITETSGLLLKVPQDYSGTGFSIEPLGVYTDREISVEAHFINDAKQSQALEGGTWELSGESFKDTTSISPVVSYTIVYDYSKYANDYYFVDSTPQCWYSKESDHTVIFQEASSLEENTNYSVLMHPFIKVDFSEHLINFNSKFNYNVLGKNGIISISQNGQSITEDLSKVKFKVSDVITIRVAKEYKITGTDVNVGTPVPLGSSADNGYEYTIIVPDTNNGIHLDITERNSDADGTYAGYNIENAELILYRKNGSEVKLGDELPADSEKVTVEIIPNEGYYITGKGLKDYSKYKKDMNYSEFQKKVKSIIEEHPVFKYVTITLDRNDDCGTCVYKLDGKNITENTVIARIGQKLELTFSPNNQYKIVWNNPLKETLANNILGKNAISEDIKITADMDGQTISRRNYSFTIERVDY